MKDKNTNDILNRLRDVTKERTKSEETKIRLVCMIADLAICAAPNTKLSKDLLDTASRDLESLMKDSPMAEMFADLLKYVAVFIDASKSSSSRKSMPLKHLVATIEKLPSEPDLLESHLERREKQGKALAELRRLLSHGESSRAQLDKLLVSVIDTLGSGRRRPSSTGTTMTATPKTTTIDNNTTTTATTTNKETEYLLRFLRYLVEVGSQIRSAGLDSPDIVSVLRKEPWHMVADVVFKHNGWKQARNLAELMQLDLVKIILRASRVAATTVVTSEEEKEEEEEEEKKKEKKNYYEGHEISMSVVEFLSSLETNKNSLLAALSCVLRNTNERIGCSFVSYALERTFSLL